MKQYPLHKYFKAAAIYPFLVSFITGVLIWIFYEQDPSYASDYFTDDGFKQTIVLLVMCSLFWTFLSATIFLNYYNKIAGNYLSSFIAWTFLPGSAILYMIYNTIEGIITRSPESNAMLNFYIIFIAIVHFTALVVSFNHFRMMRHKMLHHKMRGHHATAGSYHGKH